MAAKNSNAVVVDATISPEADKEAPALGKIGKKPSVVQKMTKTLKKRTFSFFKTFCFVTVQHVEGKHTKVRNAELSRTQTCTHPRLKPRPAGVASWRRAAC